MRIIQEQSTEITTTDKTRFMLTVAGPGSRLYQTKDTLKAIVAELEAMGLEIEAPTREQTTYTSEDVAISLFYLGGE